MPNQTTPIDQKPDRADDENPSPGAVLRTRPCPGCRADLAQLPVIARYCPHCGRDLQVTAPSAAKSDGELTSASADLVETPRKKSRLPISDLPDSSPPAERRSPILRGFARAMYLLGRRYEGALGAQHNPTEALRCYGKAAKLGNSAAKKRLDDAAGDKH